MCNNVGQFWYNYIWNNASCSLLKHCGSCFFLGNLLYGPSLSSAAAVLQPCLSVPRHFADLFPDPERPSDFPAWPWTPSVLEVCLVNADHAHWVGFSHPAYLWWDPALHTNLSPRLPISHIFWALLLQKNLDWIPARISNGFFITRNLICDLEQTSEQTG